MTLRTRLAFFLFVAVIHHGCDRPTAAPAGALMSGCSSAPGPNATMVDTATYASTLASLAISRNSATDDIAVR